MLANHLWLWLLVARAHLVPTTTFCVGLNVSEHFYAFWIPILCFETFLCSLALFRGYKSYKDQELRLQIRRRKLQRRFGDTLKDTAKLQAEVEGEGGPNILEILLRDSIMFFLMWVVPFLGLSLSEPRHKACSRRTSPQPWYGYLAECVNFIPQRWSANASGL